MAAWTAQVSHWVSHLDFAALPDPVIEAVRRAVLDTVGCLMAGRKEPVTQILEEKALLQGGREEATLLGTHVRLPAEVAALVNGASAHALDFDDVNNAVQGHPSVAIFPAALAACEWTDRDGKALICGYAAGFEVMAKLGEAIGYGHYEKGWHPTVTLGALGAAAAAGNVLQLTPQQMAVALSLAVSQAAGTRQNFGTMTKPFHAGNAARIGVLSARLAKAGFTADTHILEAPFGFFALYSGEPVAKEQVSTALASIGKKWALLEPGVDVKKYPCCYWTHRAADAALALRKEEGVRSEEIEQIEVATPPGGLTALIYPQPTTGLEGKFSMEYVVSAAFYDGALTFATFTDEAVQRPALRALETKVKKEEQPALADGTATTLNSGHVVVRVHLTDGCTAERSVIHPSGSAKQPLSWEQLVEKFRDCVDHGEAQLNLKVAVERIAALQEESSIRDWTASLASG
ncbi:MAG: MmgE/PrpD family protein [Firmicutes bacterium]|nr:MmgE/PrpD family protein [Bacillota bacterium]